MFNARFARQQPLPCQPHHGRHVRDMMWCDKPSFVQIGPLVGNYDISNIFQHGGRPPSWILKILIFRLLILIDVQICCCLPNFIKIGSPVRSPDAYNCWMFDVPLLGNSRYHGNRIMTYIIIGDVMRCDHPIFVQIGPSIGKLWHLQYFTTWRPSAILNFKNFNIYSRDCNWGPNLLLSTKFHQN